MATAVDEDGHFSMLCLVLAVGVVFVLVLFIHSFIVIVNVVDWVKGRPVALSDRVIASIGISRVVFQSACLLDIFFAFFINYDNYIQVTLINMKAMSNYSGIWLTTLLSVVFCLKISNFQNTFFIRMNTMISQRAVHFIAASVVLSIVYGGLLVWFNCATIYTNTTKTFKVTGISNVPVRLKFFIYFLLGNSVPFLIYFMASFSVIFFLCLHMHKIKAGDTLVFSLDHYYTALRSIVCCFFCYTFHVGSNLIAFYFIDSLSNVWMNVMLNIFPAMHSVILICKTPKLKALFLRLLQH